MSLENHFKRGEEVCVNFMDDDCPFERTGTRHLEPEPKPRGPQKLWHFIGIAGLTCAMALAALTVYDQFVGVVPSPPESSE